MTVATKIADTTPLSTVPKMGASKEIDRILVPSEALYESIDEAVKACVEAQRKYRDMPLKMRKLITETIKEYCIAYAEDLAYCAVLETGRGRLNDKKTKMMTVAESTPGIEDLSPKCYTGDSGATIVDYAPLGVIGAVTPVTNPTATVFNNSITVLAGGNGIVFNPHPGATRVTCRSIAIVNEAIKKCGGPANLVVGCCKPTVAGAQELFTHPLVAANLVTGGPAVVKVALQSGKKSFCAGPGNPPVVVDETADLDKAASGLIEGASFDNNMICSDEKEVFVIDTVAEALVEKLREGGCYILSESDLAKVEKVIFDGTCAACTHGMVNKDLVGMDARKILVKAGVISDETSVPDYPLLIACVPPTHPLVWTEQLMPVLPVASVKSFEEALKYAKAVEYDYKHTSSIYSSSIYRITQMGRLMNTSIFVANGPNTAGLAVGGEGYTSFSIAGTTGEGLTKPKTFTRERRTVMAGTLRCV